MNTKEAFETIQVATRRLEFIAGMLKHEGAHENEEEYKKAAECYRKACDILKGMAEPAENMRELLKEAQNHLLKL